MGRNLRSILRSLERIKQREGLGVSQQKEYMEPTFPNFLLLVLYRIADF